MPEVVKGVQAVLSSFGKAKTQDAVNIAEGLRRVAELILRTSNKYVPVELGDLKASGRVEKSAGKGFGARVTVVYGGTAPSGRLVDYAIYVHEDLEKSHAPPTSAKFLSRAVRESRANAERIMQRSIQAKVGDRKIVVTEDGEVV